jgi:hypothetical protein
MNQSIENAFSQTTQIHFLMLSHTPSILTMTRFLPSLLLFATLPHLVVCFTSSNARPTRTSIVSATGLIPGEVDTAAAFAESKFAMTPEDLIKRTKEVLSPEVGIGTKDGGECLAEDFKFCAAVVGPIGKEQYLNALGTFQLEDSFDIHQNMFGFTVSPIQPNRVYWFSNANATMIAEFAGQKEIKTEPLVFPPQVFHMDFRRLERSQSSVSIPSIDNTATRGDWVEPSAFSMGLASPCPSRKHSLSSQVSGTG